MDRVWFLTWHTYGTWLPGSDLGFVGETRDRRGEKVVHNEPGAPHAPDLPSLQGYARKIMKGAPVLLIKAQAECLFEQLKETGSVRQWTLLGISISPTHVHVLVGVPCDPAPEKILGDFKAWGTRALNKKRKQPESESWWTQGGSKRRKKDPDAVRAALEYLRGQEDAWIIWINEELDFSQVKLKRPSQNPVLAHFVQASQGFC